MGLQTPLSFHRVRDGKKPWRVWEVPVRCVLLTPPFVVASKGVRGVGKMNGQLSCFPPRSEERTRKFSPILIRLI